MTIARVLSAEPIIRYVTVSMPVRECWEDTEYYTVEQRPRGSAGSTLFGAIVGGVIGHQFGGGRGRDVATALGSVVGAAVGSDSARRRAAYDGYRTTSYSRPVQRCETVSKTHEEERIDGYNVVYKYRGQKYATTTRHDPGLAPAHPGRCKAGGVTAATRLFAGPGCDVPHCIPPGDRTKLGR